MNDCIRADRPIRFAQGKHWSAPCMSYKRRVAGRGVRIVQLRCTGTIHDRPLRHGKATAGRGVGCGVSALGEHNGPHPPAGNCGAREGPHPLDPLGIICWRERPIDGRHKTGHYMRSSFGFAATGYGNAPRGEWRFRGYSRLMLRSRQVERMRQTRQRTATVMMTVVWADGFVMIRRRSSTRRTKSDCV